MVSVWNIIGMKPQPMCAWMACLYAYKENTDCSTLALFCSFSMHWQPAYTADAQQNSLSCVYHCIKLVLCSNFKVIFKVSIFGQKKIQNV